MKAANVTACDELVELVAASRPRFVFVQSASRDISEPACDHRFVFVSSVSAACRGAAETIDSTPESQVTALGGGYGQSKWVAERRLA